MKRKFIPVITAALFAAALTACGSDKSTQNGAAAKPAQTDGGENKTAANVSDSTAASDAEKDLPNWRGVSDRVYIDIGEYTVGDETKSGKTTITIEYPSLKPTSGGKFAYQWDPALVLVTGCGLTEKEVEVSWSDKPANLWLETTLEKLEDAFDANKDELIEEMRLGYRNMAYDDFDFKVESQELMTVNGFAVCKYSGTHTYTYEYTEPNEKGGLDRIIDERESKFVVFAVDTDQLDGRISPYMITIIDDSIENPSKDPLPEGLIDIYGMKMVESIEIYKPYWEE